MRHPEGRAAAPRACRRERLITGLRTEQSEHRRSTPFAELDDEHTLIKINPLADWTARDVARYVADNRIPYNALHDRGFPSIGCAPCTRAIRIGERGPLVVGRGSEERMRAAFTSGPKYKRCDLNRHGRKRSRLMGYDAPILPTPVARPAQSARALSHLQRLESESIFILREAFAQSRNPVLLYSIGKDSSVLLHLAMKAFYPVKPPFPMLHVDTTWKFREMIAFRDARAKELGLELIVHTNQDGVDRGINPFVHGSELHTDVMKTQALRQALDKYGFDAAIGGARRDEEVSRAKERVFSLRSASHGWDSKRQRPEPWRLYNGMKRKGESVRVFPLSNWTERDIWLYIHQEQIPIVLLYYAAKRPVVNRGGTLIMIDDDRMPLEINEKPQVRSVRFRTLGCYPLTGAIESSAATLPDIILETLTATTSERWGRLIDCDSASSMERKKERGYF